MVHLVNKKIWLSGIGILVMGALLVAPESAEAQRGGRGGHSLGGNFIFTSPSQDDLDTLIDNANTTAGGISTKPMGQGYELGLQYMYRFSGSMFALLFRPSMFMQSSLGKDNLGARYNYELMGFTFFPMFRLIPLENSFMKFFMQMGMGYGRLTGKIRENTSTVEFAGGSFGASLGLGSEFCFFKNHCFALEGNVRYLPFERNMVRSVSAPDGWPGSLISGPPEEGGELEMNNRDLGTTLSGVLATLSYTYYF